MKPLLIILILLIAGKYKSQTEKKKSKPRIIYQIRDDFPGYSSIINHIPVGYDKERREITWHRDNEYSVSDIRNIMPLQLKNNWYMDRTGAEGHIVLLDYTYEEYRQMENINPKELVNHIYNTSPFYKLYECPASIGINEIQSAFKKNKKEEILKQCSLQQSIHVPKPRLDKNK